jgi:hypothetical protein
MIDVSTIISVIVGILLTISESLPFIKSVKAQGIVHFLINILINNTNNELRPLLYDHEPQLINQYEQESEFQQNREIHILIDNINVLSTNVNYISQILKDTSNDFKTARQLKLQTSELYQLNYIINYIKQNYIKRQLKFKNLSKNNKELLSSEGYIINYDSQEDTSVISW